MVIENSNGEVLTDKVDIINRWTEYCSSLYNFNLQTNSKLTTKTERQMWNEESLPVIKSEVEAAINNLKPGKSPGLDNVPAELLKHGGDHVLNALTNLYKKKYGK